MLKILIVLIGCSSAASWADDPVYTTHWIADEEVASTLLEMEDNRLFPCLMEGIAQDYELLYRVSFCPFSPDMHSFDTKWGLPANTYNKWAEYYTSIGMVEHFHKISTLNGVTAHHATWKLIDESQSDTEAAYEAEEENGIGY